MHNALKKTKSQMDIKTLFCGERHDMVQQESNWLPVGPTRPLKGFQNHSTAGGSHLFGERFTDSI